MVSSILLMIFSTVHSGPADCGPESMSVVSGDVWRNDKRLSAFFGVDNIFTHNKAERNSYAGYWLAPDRRAATFIVNLGCQQDFSAIRLVNTHNQNHRDRSTKKFRLSVSVDLSQPWTSVLETSLEDSRHQQDPLPLQVLHLKESVKAQFIKFDLLEWYGVGGGLQYMDIKREADCPKGWSSHGQKCYKLFQNKLSWYDAYFYCRREGGNLVSVHSKAENEFVARLDSDLWSLWLGAGRERISNTWLWVDGSPFSFHNWRKNEPNNFDGIEDCLELWKDDYVWNDNGCSKRMKFVCKKKL